MSTPRVYLGIGATGPRGPQGFPGVGADWQGVWSSGTTYTKGQGVSGSNGHNYISQVDGNIGHDPTIDDGSHWADLVPGSAAMTLEQFGAVPNVVSGPAATANQAAWLAAIDSITVPNGAYIFAVTKLILGYAFYYFGASPVYIDRPITIAGQGGGGQSTDAATVLVFADGTPGIEIDYAPGTGGFQGGNGTHLQGFQLAAVGHTNADAHAIVAKNNFSFDDISAYNFGGDGFNVDAAISLGFNATNWRMDNCVADQTGNGFFIAGGNAGGGHGRLCMGYQCRRWALVDDSFGVLNKWESFSAEFPYTDHVNALEYRSGGGISAGWVTRDWILKDIGVSDSTVWISDATAALLPATGVIFVGNEQIKYTTITRAVGNANVPTSRNPAALSMLYATLGGLTRGFNSTTAAQHLQQQWGDSVLTYFYWPEAVDYYQIQGGAVIDTAFTEQGAGQICRAGDKSSIIGDRAPGFTGYYRVAETTAGINNSVTTVPVKTTIGMPSSGTFMLDAEEITYAGVTATSLTGCTRHVNGTSAASHSTQAWVMFANTATMGLPSVLERGGLLPFDFQASGSLYYVASKAITFFFSSAVKGGGTGYTIAYAVNGTTKTLPFSMAVDDELAVTVSGLSGRISFSLQGL